MLTLPRRGSIAAISVVFVTAYAVMEVAVLAISARGGLESIQGWTARGAGSLAQGIGISAAVSGQQILLRNHILQIDMDCTGVTLLALYTALVVAYPLAWRTRLTGLVAGIPLLVGVNLLRLLGVVLASEHLGADAFAFVHDYLFKVGMVLAVITLWAVWLGLARAHAANS